MQSNISFDTKLSIILPKCYFTELVVGFYNRKVLLNDAKETLNELRIKPWISKARNFILNFMFAKKFESRAYEYPAASTDLPNSCLSPNAPFGLIAVDNARPLYVSHIFHGDKVC